MSIKHYATMAKVFPEPIAFLQSNGEILYLNNPFRKVISQNGTNLVGKNITDIVSNEANKISEYLKKCSRTRQMVFGTLHIPNGNGKPDKFVCECGVLNPAEENVPASVVLRLKKKENTSERFALLTDKINQLNKEIAARRTAEQRNRELYKKANEANRLKDEFLSTISSELRTPLTSILGWTRMLRWGEPEEELYKESLETIELITVSQVELIDNLLDVSQFITGKVKLNRQPVDLGEVIESVVESTHLTAKNKSIDIVLDLEPKAGVVLGDSEKLRKVIWNLISNSLKFTPPQGQVKIKLENIGSNAEVTFTDSGKGILPEALPFVFDRFSKVTSDHAKKYGGLGIGLSIVKHFVELHGGTVEAFSKGEDMGTTFTFKLPVLFRKKDVKLGLSLNKAIMMG